MFPLAHTVSSCTFERVFSKREMTWTRLLRHFNWKFNSNNQSFGEYVRLVEQVRSHISTSPPFWENTQMPQGTGSPYLWTMFQIVISRKCFLSSSFLSICVNQWIFSGPILWHLESSWNILSWIAHFHPEGEFQPQSTLSFWLCTDILLMFDFFFAIRHCNFSNNLAACCCCCYSVMSDFFATPWTAACQGSLSFTT